MGHVVELVQQALPDLAREVVAHSVDLQQLGERDGGRGMATTGDRNERIGRTVHDQGGNRQLAQGRRPVVGRQGGKQLPRGPVRVVPAVPRHPSPPTRPLAVVRELTRPDDVVCLLGPVYERLAARGHRAQQCGSRLRGRPGLLIVARGRGDRRQAAYPIGKVQRKRLDDHATQRAPQDVRGLPAQSVHQTDGISRHVQESVGSGVGIPGERGREVRLAKMIKVGGKPDVPVVVDDDPETSAHHRAEKIRMPADKLLAQPADDEERQAAGVTVQLVRDFDAIGLNRAHRRKVASRRR